MGERRERQEKQRRRAPYSSLSILALGSPPGEQEMSHHLMGTLGEPQDSSPLPYSELWEEAGLKGTLWTNRGQCFREDSSVWPPRLLPIVCGRGRASKCPPAPELPKVWPVGLACGSLRVRSEVAPQWRLAQLKKGCAEVRLSETGNATRLQTC